LYYCRKLLLRPRDYLLIAVLALASIFLALKMIG